MNKLKKRNMPNRYRKGVEVHIQQGSLREQAYNMALNAPDKLSLKLRIIVNEFVRSGNLIREHVDQG